MSGFRATHAQPIAAQVALSEQARGLLTPTQTPHQYLAALREAGFLVESVHFLSWALPRREAIWWACQCVRSMFLPTTAPIQVKAIEITEKWAALPTDENRRAAHAIADTAGYGTPGGCAAVAAFFSGGSLAPPNLPAVAPAEHLCPKSVANAVLLAALQNEPLLFDERLGKFLDVGLTVAAGTNRWKEDRPVPARR